MTSRELRSTNATPSLLQSAARVFELSFGQLLWSKRSIFLALVVGVPILLGLIVRIASTRLGPFQINGTHTAGTVVFGGMIWLLYVRFAVPVLGVFYGTSLIADEVDDKTITYLFTRPIPRRAVLFGKYAAFVVCTALLVLPSVVVVFFLVIPTLQGSIAAAFPSLLADLGMLTVGLIAYGAVFALVGARMKRPLTVGLVFAFGWEPTVMLLPGYLKRLTVSYYLQALVSHQMPQDSALTVLMQAFQETPAVSTALLSLGGIVVLALWAAAQTVEYREYVLEQ